VIRSGAAPSSLERPRGGLLEQLAGWLVAVEIDIDDRPEDELLEGR
jgi:hypothetical protein